MSWHGEWQAATVASGAVTTSAIDLGRDCDWISLEIPTMDIGQLSLKVAETLGGTYYELGRETSTTESDFNRAETWTLGGWRYIKIVSTTTQTAERLIRVKGMRY